MLQYCHTAMGTIHKIVMHIEAISGIMRKGTKL